MNYRHRKNGFNYRFDFEIGYLVKSPCKECERKKSFPECEDDCITLDKIHTILAKSVSLTRSG